MGKFDVGGSEAHLARLVFGLDRKRHRIEVMVCQAGGAFYDQVLRAGVTIHNINVQPGPAGALRGARAVRRILELTKPDILQTYGYTCDLLGTMAVMPRSRVKLITTRRGNEPSRRKQRTYGWLSPFVHSMLSVSEASLEFALRTEGRVPKRRLVIPNGIDLAPFLAVPPVERTLRTIGTVGRLRPVKGSDLLLEAFSRVHFDGLELRLAGPLYKEGSPNRELWGKQLYETRRNDPGVQFVGEVHDIPAFHQSIDLFVLPSRSEGMSNALIEAMASGLPIIATAVGGNPETLGHGEAGLLVPPDATAIAEAIQSLLDDPEKARDFGHRARARAQREYSLETMVRRYEQFYQEMK